MWVYLRKHLTAAVGILAAFAALLVNFREAASGIANAIPQTLSVIRILLPVFFVGGIASAGVWIAATVIEAVENKRKKKNRWIRAVVETGYVKLRAACEPETVDGAHNVASLRADARDHVNLVVPLLRGGGHPEVCTMAEESLREWFAVFAKLRMQRGMALLAAEDLVRREADVSASEAMRTSGDA